MPTYEYECRNNGKRFEVFQGISDDPLQKCPGCGGPVKRLISGGSAVVFKGRGFFATDHGRSPGPAPACGREERCCGRDTPCDSPPCDG